MSSSPLERALDGRSHRLDCTPEATAPIFIIGTERSGSNLLRLILDAHPRIAIPHPPHVFRYFADLESTYGDLGEDGNLRALARDVLRLLDAHISRWPIRPEAEDLVRDADPRDLFGVFSALYDAYRKQMGKDRWGCKSTFMIHHVERILSTFPRARLIWLVRDPRDVACSSRRSVFNPFHPYFTAQLWRNQQEEGLRLLGTGARGCVHRVHYESLIRDPEKTVEELCSFLGEAPHKDMLRFFEGSEARRLARLSRDWSNAASPIMSTNHGMFLRDLSRRELLLVESAAMETMQLLGYEPVTTAVERSATSPRLRWLRCQDFALRFRVEADSLLHSPNHWRRWWRAIVMVHIRVRRLRWAS